MHTGNTHFSDEELSRYNRHIIIPGFGMEAQEKLKAAKVLVVGCGGLGSPVLLYLAAAGIGKIGMIDHDLVDDSNLQRQVLFNVADIGHSKVDAASEKIKQLNPYISLIEYPLRLTAQNALDIISEYDVIADGTDNFTTRYLINDACVLLGKPYVYASIHQFEGQVSVFNFKMIDGETGPNYRDLYPQPPAPGLIQDCAQGGVLGVLPGIIGSMQALEVIKVITGLGEALSGRFYMFDALQFESRVLKVKKDPANPLYQDDAASKGLINYEAFCSTQTLGEQIKEVSAAELKRWQSDKEDIQIIDVREPYEYKIKNIGAQLIPLNQLATELDKIDKTKKVVIHCEMGARSIKAIHELQQKYGFQNLYNLKGGMIAYLKEL